VALGRRLIMRCTKCGYFEGDHELVTLKCPICACGATPAEHDPHCPGKISEKTGEPMSLRRGSFAAPGPVAPVREWLGMLVPMTEAELAARVAAAVPDTEVVEHRPPQVVARLPHGPAEVAGGTRKAAAVKLGKLARAAGWRVQPMYWRAGDGTEGCALRLAGPDNVRAVALWERPAGHVGELTGWGAKAAYAWRPGSGTFPVKVTHADIEKLLAT
jgi:hypothetical protein